MVVVWVTIGAVLRAACIGIIRWTLVRIYKASIKGIHVCEAINDWAYTKAGNYLRQ